MQYFVSWASTIAGIGFFFDYLEKTVKGEARIRLVNWMLSFSEVNINSRLESVVSIFVEIFLKIYGPWNERLSKIIWASLLCGFYTITSLSVINAIYANSSLSVESTLYYSIITCPILAAYYTITLKFIFHTEQITRKYFASKTVHFCVGFLLGCVVSIPIGFSFTLFSNVAGFNIGKLEWSIATFPTFALFFLIIFKLKNFNIVISPIKATISSVISIIFISAFVPQLSLALLAKIVIENPLLLSYIGLNIFADTLSLLETYFLLGLIGKSKMIFKILLFFLDIILTTIIFSIIPIMTGEFRVFSSAIFFSGPKSWMGIFFWSTFFTSFIFYSYCISAISLFMVHHSTLGVKKLTSFFPIQRSPFRCMGLILMIFFTIGIFTHWILI